MMEREQSQRTFRNIEKRYRLRWIIFGIGLIVSVIMSIIALRIPNIHMNRSFQIKEERDREEEKDIGRDFKYQSKAECCRTAMLSRCLGNRYYLSYYRKEKQDNPLPCHAITGHFWHPGHYYSYR